MSAQLTSTALLTVVFILAFASPPPALPDLESTRAFIERVASDDDARRLYGDALDRAHHALVSAERLYADGQAPAVVHRQLQRARAQAELAWTTATAFRRRADARYAVIGSEPNAASLADAESPGREFSLSDPGTIRYTSAASSNIIQL